MSKKNVDSVARLLAFAVAVLAALVCLTIENHIHMSDRAYATVLAVVVLYFARLFSEIGA